jgi:hypothetical protein
VLSSTWLTSHHVFSVPEQALTSELQIVDRKEEKGLAVFSEQSIRMGDGRPRQGKKPGSKVRGDASNDGILALV